MKISRLKIQSAAVVQLRYFYRQVIGFPVVGDDDSIIIYAGKTIIEVVKAPIGEYPVYHFAFNIPSNKIEEAQEWLKSRVELLYMDDYKSEIADFVNWHAKSLYFYDPAGNVVEFIARFDLNDDEEATFSPTQIRYVSEIGMVFDKENFDHEMENFMKNYSLSYFDKQPPLPHFRAMGDDEGLIIAVPANREWYPTKNVYSTKAPVSITWQQDDVTHNYEWGFE
jgi:hypothetical protein